jgi:glucose dehydrogenase
VLGEALWALAALNIGMVLLAGFVGWDVPNIYITGLLVAVGLLLNLVLLRRGRALRPVTATVLVVVSIALSAVVLGFLAYVALDLGR